MRHRAGGRLALLLFLTVPLTLFVAPAAAEDFDEVLLSVIARHDRALGAAEDIEAARQRVKSAFSGWYPSVALDASIGVERQIKPEGENSDLTPREGTITVTQLLWDFGVTNNTIDRSRLSLARAEIDRTTVIRDLIQEFATAHANLVRADRVLSYAEQSLDNIQRQTGLEEARIDAGSGLSTDVLQAKTQLAGARARLVSAQGGLREAVNRYRALADRAPGRIADLPHLMVAPDIVPSSLDGALEIALEQNDRVIGAAIDAAIAGREVQAARGTEYFPTVELEVEQGWDQDVDGTEGYKSTSKATVGVSFPFDLGFTGRNRVAAARHDQVSKGYGLADVRRTVEEEVRNAWSRIEAARQRTAYLGDQADIAQAFLDLAREERQLGRRSLIDVLSGETSLINARSDAEAARTDLFLANLGLLRATGQLEPSVFQLFLVPPVDIE